jgi:uncharacterized protein
MNTAFFHFRISLQRLAFFSAATALLLLTGSGCAMLQPAKSETHYYLLNAAASPAKSADHNKTKSGFVVRLLPVEMANYLQTKDVAVRTETNEVTFAMFQRWAEPLADGIRRVLGEDLRAAPEIRAVITDQPAASHRPVYVISVHVLNCEGSEANHHGSADFKAVWEITRSDANQTVVAHGVFQSPPMLWHPGDYSQLADQLSRALNHFSHALANAISQHADSASQSAS